MGAAWFLKIDPVRIVGMRACVYVCVSVPKAINNQWHDMDLIRLVKLVLQLLYGNYIVVIINGCGLGIGMRRRH